ncbi:hypothetical protein BOTBODRAFT_56551 [Botryobasidium botryosum FD-172 SS1]|uniref:Uncharacterized protein n=1 Tax=Botryobasidium botryosum (strain FD-172 SS1) TaxID=930990 RepID=A0A067MAZ3_BOTB1|nr:hypothetical protein BOTBODRAFT_56551 [Botryobasidium botryosum FD-172 SS1]
MSATLATTTTAKFQLSLPLALLAVSPQLAALHASRARLVHQIQLQPSNPPLTPLSCSKCGSFLLPGAGCVRMGRAGLKRRASRKTSKPSEGTEDGGSEMNGEMTRACHVCGYTERVLLRPSSNRVASFESARKVAKRPRLQTQEYSSSSAGPPGPSDLHMKPPPMSVSRTSTPPDVLSPAPTPLPPSVPTSRHSTPLARSPSESIPTPKSNPKSESQPESKSKPKSDPFPPPRPVLPASSSAPTPPTGKSRSKKRSGLQELLTRNREQQQQQQKQRDRQAASGLAGFLSSL